MVNLVVCREVHQLQPVGVVAAGQNNGNQSPSLQPMNEQVQLLCFTLVADSIHDHCDQTRLPIVQRPGDGIWLIPILLCHRENADARLLTDSCVR